MSDQDPQPQQQVVYVEKKTNGMAAAALVLGVVGAVMGLVPLTGFIALICGVLGLIFGIAGFRRGSELGRKGMAGWGAALSAVAIALGVIGLVIVGDAVSELERDLEEFEQEIEDL